MAEALKDDTAFVSNKEDSLQHEQYALDAKDYKCILLLLQAVYFVDDKHCNVLIGLGVPERIIHSKAKHFSACRLLRWHHLKKPCTHDGVCSSV